MRKRIARLVLFGSGVTVLVMALAMMWLKAHEDELVFAAARSRQHLLTVLPADAELAAAAANQPKHLITFDVPTGDGFGGHVDALYEHVDVLRSALAGLIPATPPPVEL
jgi:hypothetical protein